MDKEYFVYIMRCADQTYYTGIAKDVQKRLCEHNLTGRGAKYTRARRPVVLVFFESCASRSGAMMREMQIKKLSRKDKETLILNCGFFIEEPAFLG